jgi:hypothetical protein
MLPAVGVAHEPSLVPHLAWSLYATALTAAVSPDGATDIAE